MAKHAQGSIDLDRALDAYRCQARSVKPRSATQTAMYTAAAGAALALAPATDAAVQTSSISGFRILTSSWTSMQIDINNDGFNDFLLSVFRSGTPMVTLQNLSFIRGALGNGVAMTSSGSLVARIPQGGTIGPSNVFQGQGLVKFFQASTTTGSPGVQRVSGGWPGNSADGGFLGFKFLIGANTHYGWIRLSITNESYAGYDAPMGFTVLGGAWEDQPDTSLFAGVIPEPSTTSALALLAAGAAGIGAWRRRKQAK